MSINRTAKQLNVKGLDCKNCYILSGFRKSTRNNEIAAMHHNALYSDSFQTTANFMLRKARTGLNTLGQEIGHGRYCWPSLINERPLNWVVILKIIVLYSISM